MGATGYRPVLLTSANRQSAITNRKIIKSAIDNPS